MAEYIIIQYRKVNAATVSWLTYFMTLVNSARSEPSMPSTPSDLGGEGHRIEMNNYIYIYLKYLCILIYFLNNYLD